MAPVITVYTTSMLPELSLVIWRLVISQLQIRFDLICVCVYVYSCLSISI